MQYPYPIFLDLADKPCIVFGSGPMAEEKIAELRAAGAQVRHLAEPPIPQHLEGVFLAVSAWMDSGVNRMLFEEAERRGVLFNALDDPPNCRFYFPAVHRQGALVVALSTSGQCPALAVRLKEKLASWIGPEYAEFLRIAASVRERIRSSGLGFAERRRIWYRLVDSPALAQLSQSQAAEAELGIKTILDEELGPRASIHSDLRAEAPL